MKKIFKMEDLECAHCAAKMEKAIAGLHGVESVAISFLAQKMTVHFAENADIAAICKEIAAICKKIEPDCRVLF